MEDIVKALRIGLSRLLRYSYGGFLLVILAWIVNRPITTQLLGTVPWQVAVLGTLVAGAAIYAAHRSLIIHVHHLGLCLILRILEIGTSLDHSLSPTRWLGGKIGVSFGQRITAYTLLRRSDFFSETEKDNIDLAHAESGTVVMTGSGFLVAALYAQSNPSSLAPPWILFVLAVLFLVGSYPGAYLQHRLECVLFRARESDVRAKLNGFPPRSSQANPRPGFARSVTMAFLVAIALIHSLRFLFGWQVPVWLSAVGGLVALVLALGLWRESRRGPDRIALSSKCRALPYDLAQWQAEDIALKRGGDPQPCPCCARVGFYAPRLGDGPRYYRACKYCGFWQDIDRAPHEIIRYECCAGHWVADWKEPHESWTCPTCGSIFRPENAVAWPSEDRAHWWRTAPVSGTQEDYCRFWASKGMPVSSFGIP